MSVFPFPANLSRVFDASYIEVIKRDKDDNPIAVCVTTETTGDLAVGLVLLRNSPDSFVLFEKTRYFPDGTVQACDPVHPSSVAELHAAFDTEPVESGPPPRVYLFTHSRQEWEDARQAVRVLVARGLLSPRSYIEGNHTGQAQGLLAKNLDATPHGPDLVALIREAAYCTQNDLYERAEYDEFDEEEFDEDEEEDNVFEDEEFEEDDAWQDEDENHAPVTTPHRRLLTWFRQILISFVRRH